MQIKINSCSESLDLTISVVIDHAHEVRQLEGCEPDEKDALLIALEQTTAQVLAELLPTMRCTISRQLIETVGRHLQSVARAKI